MPRNLETTFGSLAAELDDESPPVSRFVDHERIEQAVREILIAVGEDPDREGLLETPARVARMYAELFSGLHDDPRRHLRKFFTEKYDEVVLVRDISFNSMCEHHLLPFMGTAHIGYLPNGRVIGLSKLARVVEVVSKRPQVQERMTETIADLLVEELRGQGSGRGDRGLALVHDDSRRPQARQRVRHLGDARHLPLEPVEPIGDHDAHLRRPAVALMPELVPWVARPEEQRAWTAEGSGVFFGQPANCQDSRRPKKTSDPLNLTPPLAASTHFADCLDKIPVLILSQFILRLSFGLAAAMFVVPPRQVTSGYYRNNLYVLLGLNVLAVLVAWATPNLDPARWPAVMATAASYVGSVMWLYEKPRAGMLVLAVVAAASLLGAWLTTPAASAAPDATSTSVEAVVAAMPPGVFRRLDTITSGLLLGATTAAMLLGHWYLNSPGMPLAPLKRLVLLVAAAVLLRAVVCGGGFALELAAVGSFSTSRSLFVALRWLGGLVGTGVLALMAWKTLAIPNTQSATGILYVAVIGVFLGELMSQLLSAEALFPL